MNIEKLLEQMATRQAAFEEESRKTHLRIDNALVHMAEQQAAFDENLRLSSKRMDRIRGRAGPLRSQDGPHRGRAGAD